MNVKNGGKVSENSRNGGMERERERERIALRAGYAETPKGLIQTLFETPFPGFNANTVFETPRLFFVRRYCS